MIALYSTAFNKQVKGCEAYCFNNLFYVGTVVNKSGLPIEEFIIEKVKKNTDKKFRYLYQKIAALRLHKNQQKKSVQPSS